MPWFPSQNGMAARIGTEMSMMLFTDTLSMFFRIIYPAGRLQVRKLGSGPLASGGIVRLFLQVTRYWPVLREAAERSPKMHKPKQQNLGQIGPQNAFTERVNAITQDVAGEQPQKIPQIEMFVGE